MKQQTFELYILRLQIRIFIHEVLYAFYFFFNLIGFSSGKLTFKLQICDKKIKDIFF